MIKYNVKYYKLEHILIITLAAKKRKLVKISKKKETLNVAIDRVMNNP